MQQQEVDELMMVARVSTLCSCCLCCTWPILGVGCALLIVYMWRGDELPPWWGVDLWVVRGQGWLRLISGGKLVLALWIMQCTLFCFVYASEVCRGCKIKYTA